MKAIDRPRRQTRRDADDALARFHPAVGGWFRAQFAAPTPTQREAWEAFAGGSHVLLAAPTGSGKTLAGFLAAIDQLVKEAERGALADAVRVIYVSPLKALSNDIRRNLEAPLAQIHARLQPGTDTSNTPRITTAVRTGDTTAAERARMLRKPPHILVTTPESLYILLTSESGRRMCATATTLIIDEIHALAGNKRGAHLALSAERLQALCAARLTRIGLSATQEPIDAVAAYLAGARADKPCVVINSGHARARDLGIELPGPKLQAVMAGEAWSALYDRLAQLIEAHRTTLIFVNTRRMAERMAKALSERESLGEAVTAHHGSLAKEHRLQAEQQLKAGKLRALIATASLELGIDIGDIDLVCQIGSPRAISVFLQRVGRSGHQVDAVPKGRLFPLSRDDLVECAAIVDAVARGKLDALRIPPQPLDVLAQQLVAEVSAGERALDELYQLVTRAEPYRALTRRQFDEVVQMLADGFSTRRGRRSAYLHLDAVNARVRPRRGARLTALTNGGAIADQFDYDVILEPGGQRIGTLNEDFSFESLPGDIFQLGNASYRILRVQLGKVFVSDAAGQPPTIPFWFGNAPGRSDALSAAVCELRRRVEEWLADGLEATAERAQRAFGLSADAATQLCEYLGAAWGALGALPTADTVIFERFFDEAGDQHLVVHSPFGSRVNRAWGLALRKRFCRKFNFELQAAAVEDALVLSLGGAHSFALEDAVGYLKPGTVRAVATQALLAAPLFPTQWRWNASIALAVKRFSGGKKTPPQFQRSDAEDLVAVVFPEQLACQENLAGEREIPDHPLVAQTLHDCLNELMDIAQLERILTDIRGGRIAALCRDLVAPSPLAEEILLAKPYAFLDDAPAEERRTSLVDARRALPPEDAAALGQLNADAIAEVRREAWPTARDADECHDALMILGAVTDTEAGEHRWHGWLDELSAARRATRLQCGDAALWVAAERLELLLAVCPGAALSPAMEPVSAAVEPAPATADDALTALLRFRLQGMGPVTVAQLAALFCIAPSAIERALESLEGEGYAMRGHFDPAEAALQWCERGLLARIHRRTLARLRERVRPASVNGFMRFLFHWHGIGGDDSNGELDGADALAALLAQLEGAHAPGAAWESEVLPLRINGYLGHWLDNLCAGGAIRWARLCPPDTAGKSSLKVAPIALVRRRALKHWLAFGGAPRHQSVAIAADDERQRSAHARRLVECLRAHGPLFFDELLDCGGWLAAEVTAALSELAAAGVVASDSFAGLRALASKPGGGRRGRRRGRVAAPSPLDNAGRWFLLRAHDNAPPAEHWESVDYIARALLKRYGVVFRKLLGNESNLPPWRDLHYVYRRMESRGEVRGGRFVDGMEGEQFALPEAVGALRRCERATDNALIALSAADPLNLTGVILPGDRASAHAKNRILFRNGAPIATLTAGKIHWLTALPQPEQWGAQQKLIVAAGGVGSKKPVTQTKPVILER